MGLKIYTQDHWWAGSIVVVAENEAEAREIMEKGDDSSMNSYDKDKPIEEHEIKKGFRFVNYGDS